MPTSYHYRRLTARGFWVLKIWAKLSSMIKVDKSLFCQIGFIKSGTLWVELMLLATWLDLSSADRVGREGCERRIQRLGYFKSLLISAAHTHICRCVRLTSQYWFDKEGIYEILVLCRFAWGRRNESSNPDYFGLHIYEVKQHKTPLLLGLENQQKGLNSADLYDPLYLFNLVDLERWKKKNTSD